MEPATSIVIEFGGAAKVARILGVSRGRVYAWMWPKARGGSEGRIPQKYHARLLTEARALGLSGVTADRLIFGGEPQRVDAAE